MGPGNMINITRLTRPAPYVQRLFGVRVRRTGGPRPELRIPKKTPEQNSENNDTVKSTWRSLMPDGALPRDITTKEDIWRGGFGVGTLSRMIPYQDVEPLNTPKKLGKKKKTKFRKPWDTTPLRKSKLGTALHWAVDPWKEEEARAILDQRVVDINAKNDEGQTALHVLVTQDKPEAAQLLLDYGADVNAADDVGVTPLHCAAYHKSKMVMKVLLDAGADIEAQDDKMKTPLYAAIRRNAVIPATILLEAGARVNPLEGAITSVIHFATRLKRKRILALLLDRVDPANVDFREPDRTTPLHIAAEQGQYSAAYMLLRKQADINAQDANGNTPLHLAVAELKTTTVAVLRRLGANPRPKNYDGMIPDKDFVKKHEHQTIKGLPGLERLNEDAEQRRAREDAVMHERRIRKIRRMGNGPNWDDLSDDAKAKRTEMTRYHVKLYLKARGEKKKQTKIIGKKGKKFHHWELRGQIGAGGIRRPGGRSVGLIFPPARS